MIAKPTITRWEAAAAPTESDLRQRFAAEGLSPYSWSNGPGDTWAPHTHHYHKVIMVARGSITFGLPETNQAVELHAGDRLDLPPGIVHYARVGAQGVVCLEARV